jgi:soluble lytic murein transglycosylase-like protein
MVTTFTKVSVPIAALLVSAGLLTVRAMDPDPRPQASAEVATPAPEAPLIPPVASIASAYVVPAESSQTDVAVTPEPRESAAARRARFLPRVIAEARAIHVNPALVHAVISAESAYDPAAISRTGAVGLMQLMPETAQRYGVTDRYDPEQNIAGGTRYLRDLLNRFHSNLKLTIAAYNAICFS